MFGLASVTIDLRFDHKHDLALLFNRDRVEWSKREREKEKKGRKLSTVIRFWKSSATLRLLLSMPLRSSGGFVEWWSVLIVETNLSLSRHVLSIELSPIEEGQLEYFIQRILYQYTKRSYLSKSFNWVSSFHSSTDDQNNRNNREDRHQLLHSHRI